MNKIYLVAFMFCFFSCSECDDNKTPLNVNIRNDKSYSVNIYRKTTTCSSFFNSKEVVGSEEYVGTVEPYFPNGINLNVIITNGDYLVAKDSSNKILREEKVTEYYWRIFIND